MDIASSQLQNGAQTYLPEPDGSALQATLGQFINSAVSTGAQVASSALGGAIGGVPTSASGSFGDLINAQIQVQLEMQTTSMVSNIEHSRHETKMAAIRNIKVG